MATVNLAGLCSANSQVLDSLTAWENSATSFHSSEQIRGTQPTRKRKSTKKTSPMTNEKKKTTWMCTKSHSWAIFSYQLSDTGWWLTHPTEKYEFVNWDDENPNIWKNKIHVPNHQPVSSCIPIFTADEATSHFPRNLTYTRCQQCCAPAISPCRATVHLLPKAPLLILPTEKSIEKWDSWVWPTSTNVGISINHPPNRFIDS